MADFLDALSPEAEKRLKSYHNEVLSLISDIGKANATPIGGNSPSGSTSAIKTLTDQVLKLEEANSSLQSKYQELANSQIRSAQNLNQEYRKNATSLREQNLLFAEQRKIANQVSKEQLGISNGYDIMLRKLRDAKKEALNIGSNYGIGSAEFKKASAEVRVLDAEYKALNTQIGNNQVEVGNYGNAITKGLGKAFALLKYITYILPGIGIAGALGFLAEPLINYLSNLNFIQKALGLQTAAQKEAAKAAKERAEEEKKNTQEIANSAATESNRARILFENIKNEKVSMDNRIKNFTELKEKYGKYLGDLTLEKALAGETAEAEARLNDALTKRGYAIAIQSLLQKNAEKQIETELNLGSALKESFDASKIYNDQQEKSIKTAKTLRAVRIDEIDNLKYYNFQSDEAAKSQDKSFKNQIKNTQKMTVEWFTLNDQRKAALKPLKQEEDALLKLYRQFAPYLAVSKEKTKEDRFQQALLEARIAYLKQLEEAEQAEFVSEKQRREFEISELEKVAKNEKATFEGRIEAYGLMLKMKQDLSINSYANDIRLLKDEQTKEESEIEKAYLKRLHDARGHSSEIAKIKNYHSDELILADQKYESKRIILVERFNKEYLDMVEDTSRAEIEIQKKRDEVLQKAEDLRTGREEKMFKDIADNENLSLEVREQAFLAQVALEHKRLDLAEIREKSENPNNIEEITEKYKGLREELEKLESPYEKTGKAAQAMYDSFAKTLTSDIFKGANLGSFEQFFDGSFKKTLDGFDSITDKATKTREKAAYAFVQIAEAAQEAFNFINQAQEQQFQAQIDRLGREKEVALGFAGESADAREEIERQYTERVKQLHRQEAEAQKRNAIFNILINTAQGIVATIGQLGFPAAIPFIAAIGIIGAAQAALVASQPIPEFKRGLEAGEHKGGLMKVNDGGGSDYREKVILPSGRVLEPIGRNVIMNTPKGTHVATKSQWDGLMFNNELNGILSSNGISSPIVVNNGISEEALTRAVIKGLSSQSQGDSFTMVHDARGIKVFQQRQNRTTELMNNKKSFTAKRIR